MGLGGWLEKKIVGKPSPEKIKREQDLKKELEDIRWKAHVEREKKRAASQGPSGLGRVVEGFGKVGAVSGKMSRGALDVLAGSGDFAVAPQPSFNVRDPLSFGGGERRRHKHRGRGGGQNITIHVHTGGRRRKR